MKKYLTALVAFAALMLGEAKADDTALIYSRDITGLGATITPVDAFSNQIYITASTVSYNTTCGSVSPVLVCFSPGSAGNFRVRANGSGVPTTTDSVTSGTAWVTNPNCREVGTPNGVYRAYTVSGSAFSAFAVWSDTVGNVIPYTCYGR